MLNICSSRNKFDDLEILLRKADFDCLSMVEFWLNNELDSQHFSIEDYHLHRLNLDAGSAKRHGRGLIVYTEDK